MREGGGRGGWYEGLFFSLSLVEEGKRGVLGMMVTMMMNPAALVCVDGWICGGGGGGTGRSVVKQ